MKLHWPKDCLRGARIPNIDPFELDLGDTENRVSPEQIAKDYGGTGFRGRVYVACVPLSDLPAPKFAEEIIRQSEYDDCKKRQRLLGYPEPDEDGYEDCDEDFPLEEVGYDWSELQMRSRRPFPAPKILVTKRGQIQILDGNHRLHFWEENNYTHVICWVLEER